MSIGKKHIGLRARLKAKACAAKLRVPTKLCSLRQSLNL